MNFLSRLFSKSPSPPPAYLIFTDPLEKFSIEYPSNWIFDQDIAIDDRKYTLAFSSKDGKSTFSLFVDLNLPSPSDFDKYAKDVLESPSSGVFCTPKKSTFLNFPAYLREYSYKSASTLFFGGGIMFLSKRAVYSLLWGGPQNKKSELTPVFDHMASSLREF
ncbi:hypothetical protein HY990_01905 [Candidatus Micrarchaeota archaeon]|nr:hypothetical protein [Candidatus Micrarchaeota archaeon]